MNSDGEADRLPQDVPEHLRCDASGGNRPKRFA